MDPLPALGLPGMKAMTVAIPIAEGRISPVLDTASRLLIVTRKRGKPACRRECVVSPLPLDAMARAIAELKVDVLLCAAVSESLRRSLEERGVRVRRHLCGDAETVLEAFLAGHLRQSDFRMPGCWGWHLDGACCRRLGTRRALASTASAKSP
jgi:predicted Fe-Mo cluster-binding NifX family protein